MFCRRVFFCLFIAGLVFIFMGILYWLLFGYFLCCIFISFILLCGCCFCFVLFFLLFFIIIFWFVLVRGREAEPVLGVLVFEVL